MKFNISSIYISVGIFCFYIFSLYLWYAARQGAIFVLLGPYVVQILANMLAIYMVGLRSAFLIVPCIAVCFAVATAFAHLIAGYFHVAIDWSGVRNFPLIFLVQLFISAIIAVLVWIVFFIANYISNKRR